MGISAVIHQSFLTRTTRDSRQEAHMKKGHPQNWYKNQSFPICKLMMWKTKHAQIIWDKDVSLPWSFPQTWVKGFQWGSPVGWASTYWTNSQKLGSTSTGIKYFNRSDKSGTSVWQSWCEFRISLYLWFVMKCFWNTISEFLSPPFLSKFKFASFSVTLNSFPAMLLQTHESIKRSFAGHFWIFGYSIQYCLPHNNIFFLVVISTYLVVIFLSCPTFKLVSVGTDKAIHWVSHLICWEDLIQNWHYNKGVKVQTYLI